MIRMIKRGEKILNILSLLEDGIMEMGDLMMATLMTPKGQQRTITYKARQLKKERLKNALFRQEEQKLRVLISKLQKDGLIERAGDLRSLTKKGLQKLNLLKEKFLRKKSYQKQNDDILKLISYDIPEKLRKHRDWFREVLRSLGFRKLHSSLWIGKVKLPADLITDLKNYKLISYIEIIGITKTGSLKNII